MKLDQLQLSTQLNIVFEAKKDNIYLERYLNLNLKCKKGNPIKSLCQNKNCIKQEGLICQNEQCQCYQQHKYCKQIIYKSLVRSFQNQIFKIPTYSKFVEQLFEKAIDKISELKDKILKRFSQNEKPFFGLSKRQQQFFDYLFKGETKHINGKFTMEIICDQMQKDKLKKKIDQIQKNFQSQFKKFNVQIQKLQKQINNKMTNFQRIFKNKMRPIPKNWNSKILKCDQDKQDMESFFKKNIKQVKLLYRASQNQFSVSKFHQMCDNIENTVTIVQNQFNKIIGGFTPLKWNQVSSGKYADDPSKESFLFSLTNNHKFQYKNDGNAIQCHTGYGAIFGGGHDLIIHNQSNNNNSSHANIGLSYTHADYPYNQTTTCQKFSGGSNNYHFKIREWEVHQIILQ